MKLASLFIASMLMLVACSTATPAMPQQWEYKAVGVHDLIGEDSIFAVDDPEARLSETLSHLGADGWELVTVLNGGSYLFKRPSDGEHGSR